MCICVYVYIYIYIAANMYAACVNADGCADGRNMLC